MPCEQTNPTQKTASKSDDANMARKSIICTYLQPEFIAERLLRLPKLSESFDLRESYVIFEEFKNAIKNKIKT